VHGHHAGRGEVQAACCAGDQHVPAPQAEAADDPGGSMTALINLLAPADRERLLERLAEWQELRRLAETPPEPPDPDGDGQDDDDTVLHSDAARGDLLAPSRSSALEEGGSLGLFRSVSPQNGTRE